MKFIFKIKIKDGSTQDEYMKAWEKGSEIIQKSKGAQGTILYKKLDDPTTLLAIATWESKQARDVAMKGLKDSDLETTNILNKHKDYADTEIIGNFEEIGKVIYE